MSNKINVITWNKINRQRVSHIGDRLEAQDGIWILFEDTPNCQSMMGIRPEEVITIEIYEERMPGK